MPCFYRIKAWRLPDGSVTLHRSGEARGEPLPLPCGKCVGCRQSRARDWMVRCGLEVQAHKHSCWVTLTYDREHLPPTLQKGHVTAFIKRLRERVAPRRFKFFACGEYGEENGRPHYHVILFGLKKGARWHSRPGAESLKADGDDAEIEAAWGMGRVQVDRLEPAAIAYVVGYTAKKLADYADHWVEDAPAERLDRETGEVVQEKHRNVIYQGPFLLMSRRPGIGADARKHWRSWSQSAVWDGKEVPVPRFLHEAFKANASPAERAAAEDARAVPLPEDAAARQQAAEVILHKKLALKSERRRRL